jgi:hypothetical protein
LLALYLLSQPPASGHAQKVFLPLTILSLLVGVVRVAAAEARAGSAQELGWL